MIDLSNVIALTLGSDDVLQIQDAVGTVLWQNGCNVKISAGSNGTVSVNGVTGNYSERVQIGTVLTIEGIADTDYGFEQWSDGVSTNPRTITVTGDLNLTANFEAVAYYNVSISAGNNGSVSVNGTTGNYSQSVLVGTTLTIEGTGNNGYAFIDWSDGSFDNPRTVTITGDTTLTASFESVALLDYFYVEDASGINNDLHIYKNTYPSEIFKSTDKLNWTSMGTTSASAITATIPANGKLYLKTTTNKWGTSPVDSCNIVCTKLYKVGGNIMSLLYNNRFYEHTTLSESFVFVSLFRNGNSYYHNKLIDASNLILPNNTTNGCYNMMFADCTSLTTAPVLPATTLVERCYNGMFRDCSRLNSVTSYAQDISASNCLGNWLNGVSATGDFYNMGGATYTSGASGIPTGWTVHTPSINVTIINTDSYTGATYQIDSETAQPVNVTGNTTFTVPTTATTLTVNRNGKGETYITGVSGMNTDTKSVVVIPVQDMSSNVTIEFISLM